MASENKIAPEPLKHSSRFEEALGYLENRINYETFRSIPYQELEARLVRLREILDFLGKPDEKYATIHIAGTKGKGSTCIILEQILAHAGYRVGRFSSPHLHSLLERFTIDGIPCEKEAFAETLLELRDRLSAWEDLSASNSQPSPPLTFFELTTLLAFYYFAREKVDFAVVEVGLGGRLDSTNVCRPIATMITSIGYDHLEQLGPTLGDIAFEKAGIIKSGIPVISGVRKPEPGEVVREIARSRNAPLYEIGIDFETGNFADSFENDCCGTTYDFATTSNKFRSQTRFSALKQPVFGEHQVRNASLALSAAALLRERDWRLPDEAIRSGIAAVRLPARVERLGDKPAWIVDGAHNRTSVQELIATLRRNFPNAKKRYLLFGTMLGKDVEGMLYELLSFFDWIVFTQSSLGPRCFPAVGLRIIAASLRCQNEKEFRSTLDRPPDEPGTVAQKSESDWGDAIPDWQEALARIRNLAGNDDLICTTGSFYLAAAVRQQLIESR